MAFLILGRVAHKHKDLRHRAKSNANSCRSKARSLWARSRDIKIRENNKSFPVIPLRVSSAFHCDNYTVIFCPLHRIRYGFPANLMLCCSRQMMCTFPCFQVHKWSWSRNVLFFSFRSFTPLVFSVLPNLGQEMRLKKKKNNSQWPLVQVKTLKSSSLGNT